MSRLHRPVSSFVLLATALTSVAVEGCEVHTTWNTGSTTSNEEVHEGNGEVQPYEAPSAKDPRSRATDAAAREQRRRQAQEDLARIDREARERVAQAEKDAAERERQAEADAERDRQQAAADAEQRQRDAEAAAKADKAQNTMHRRQATGRFDMGTQDASGAPKDEVLERRNTEINQSTEEKKATIRKQLEQNKSDILVAAERKRTEVQESLKDKPEKSP